MLVRLDSGEYKYTHMFSLVYICPFTYIVQINVTLSVYMQFKQDFNPLDSGMPQSIV